VGGHFGPELKYAGFDHIVISGKSERPVYLFLRQGTAEIRDARSIWGKTTFETEEILNQELEPLKIRIASIGPAGENRVRGSGIVCDRSKVAGGSGVGCVMGDKKLKAVVVCGQGGSIQVAEPDKFFGAMDRALRKVEDSPLSEMMRKSTLAAAGAIQRPRTGILVSARNGQDDFWEIEKRIKLTKPKKVFQVPEESFRVSDVSGRVHALL
jgi:aldehyde:ferredoxin oxidoreductase